MKIIHVISGLTKGGGERVVVELANIAVEKGDQVTILAGWRVNPEFLQNSVNSCVDIRFIGNSRNLAYFKIIPWIIKNRAWLGSHDVLHCHLTFGAIFGSIAKIILRKIFRKKKPVIVETYHAVGMPVPSLVRWLHSRLILIKDGVVLMAKDPYWSSFITKNPSLISELIPNGIVLVTPEKNEQLKEEFKKKLGIATSSKYLVGTVSMLRPDRRPDLYIPICKTIYDVMGNDAHFILGGDGVEFEKIRSSVAVYQLTEIVYMPGLVKVAAATICHMDVYVSISVGNTTGISMIEAAMCKVPVVGIQLVKDYIATESDWVWSHTELDKVAEKIIYLLNDETAREQLAAKQYAYVKEHFTADAMYTSYDSFYRKVILKTS